MGRLFRFLNVTVALALLASLFVGVAPVAAQPGPAKPLDAGISNSNAPFVPGELVVGFKPTRFFPSVSMQAAAAAKTVGAQVVKVNGYRTALLRVSANTDVNAAAANLRKQAGVAFVEPNYIYAIPQPAAESVNGVNKMQEYVIRKVKPSAETENKDREALPIEALQSLKKNSIQAVYPNDPYLWQNSGWDWVGGSILTGNTTPSANVCEIDTGVDYLHPDLAANIIKGYDFVNGDADPMDDNGHGTHVAGIMVAVPNNKQGIAGISTGKVVAVKALGAQGWGTNFDVAAAINYCANRLDVKVISMSLGGGYSDAVYYAVNNAVNVKGKLVVAAAGNGGGDYPEYPAFFSNTDVNGSADCAGSCPTFPEFANKVISVAASGQVYEDPPSSGNWWLNNDCKADYSNYGSWVSVSAPGTWIYSTLPWDKPFYLNSFYGYSTRYDSLSGTSMATPFVAASAARRWGYQPLETNDQIGADVISISSGQTTDYNGDGACWPASMNGKYQANVAALLDRGAFRGQVFDSVTGLPLTGATIGVYQGTTLKGSAIITPNTWKADPSEADPTRVYMSFDPRADVVNLPIGGAGYGQAPYVPKVNKAGYTASPQPAFQHVPWANTIYPGSWTTAPRGAVPPKSGNFDVTTGWWMNYGLDVLDPSIVNYPDTPWDLDTNVWIPNFPNPLDAGQPAPFIVGWEGDAFGFLEGDPSGAMTAFPFARFMRDGGWSDWVRVEDTTIAKRAAHGAVAANAALPYYPGDYVVMLTDWGQTIDQDGDGCGDNYGYGFDPSYDNTCGGVGTPGIPLLGTYYVPYVYVWKDGVIKAYAGFNANSVQPVAPNTPCNAPWWKALTISSGLSGSVSITVNDQCGNAYPGAGPGTGGGIQPYNGTDFTGRMGILTTPKNK